MTFDSDLEFWKMAEYKFAECLIAKNPWSTMEYAPNKKFEAWDLMLDTWKTLIRFEVKRDRMYSETWNIAIEFMYNWKPSWVLKSKSNYIVYNLWWDFYVIDRLELIAEMMQYSTVMWWDWKLSRLVLLPVERVKEIFTLYKI